MPIQVPTPTGKAEPTADQPGATVLLNAEEISNLRRNKDAYAAFIRAGTVQLAYVPQPVAVLAPDPHYTADGVNESGNTVKQLATDAQVAYRAGLC
ncbi:hypothetical protein [Hymenobacter psoromatis]|uniref:hypothetical protein n=1 Tax=Hymenobacter psoromatis TaxID=1484116 RepID=UPI001CBBF2B3|nr:hypothetical protein [Hymenobacter psoromatis]